MAKWVTSESIGLLELCGQGSSGSPQATNSNTPLSASGLFFDMYSTNQTTNNSQSGGTPWQVEWNRLASQTTPGKQADTNIEFNPRPISQEVQYHAKSLLNSSRFHVPVH